MLGEIGGERGGEYRRVVWMEKKRGKREEREREINRWRKSRQRLTKDKAEGKKRQYWKEVVNN